MLRKIQALVLCTLLFASALSAQGDSLKPPDYKTRRWILGSSAVALTAGSLVYLNQAWYSQYNSGRFHFFNDNAEWLQMDKCGHFFTTYQTGRLMMSAFNWAGASRRQQLFLGGATGFIYMTVIEVMDGFSSGWGFSWGDEVANFSGASAAILQQAFWKEQRIQVKFSYSQSGLAKYNPSLLGDKPSTQVLKDYNGQTLWLSINPSAFMPASCPFPKWLNVAVGYGAYGMIGATNNNLVIHNEQGQVLTFTRGRRAYLSLDVDLTRIRTRSKFLKSLFSIVNVLKFPAPTLRFGKGGFKAYYLYY